MINHKKVEIDGIKWLKKHGWEEIDIIPKIFKVKMEEEPFRPLLFEKDGQQFLITIFGKDSSPYDKTMGCYVNGFDYIKYTYFKMYERILGIPTGVLFWNEFEHYFSFRQLKELKQPRLYWADKTFCNGYKELEAKSTKLTDIEYRDGLRNLRRRYERNYSGKRQMLAVWDIRYFREDTGYQKTLI